MADAPRIELYLRSLAPTTGREHQEEIVDRLETLNEADRIRGFEIQLCGDCVCPTSVTAQQAPGKQLLNRYERFVDWAEHSEYDLAGFETREIDSMLTGTTATGVVFPRIVLAEYRRESLSFVAPATNGTETVTVAERLETY